MSGILIAKEIRHRFKDALKAAGMSVDAGAGPMPVTVLDVAPAGWVLPEDKLPALYVFSTGEGFSYESLSEVTRQLFLDVALMARGGGDPMDQLDDMQLAVEQAVIGANGFGLARTCRPVSVDPAQNQGAVLIGTRLIKFEITYGVTPGDPSL
ncbi:MAG: hypothetical protein EpisKO_05850 [Epibacterium sp.]